jgi:Predicted acyl-CoA transferases/carnitine dehydratase
MPGPLAGLKVIELCHIMAGPTCGLMLADMGADVIKVEKIPGGDDVRRAVPPTIGEEAAAFLMMNRNKRGIAVDLKTEDGKEMLRRLLKDADVVTENYRRGVMERMGFGYERLRRDNPKLIYCSISGFGRTGPYAERAGFDLVAQGMSGLMSITGEGPGRPPACSPPWVSSPRCITARRPARGRWSIPRCSRRASSTPTGSRPLCSRLASRRARWARRIRSARPIRRSRLRTAGSLWAPPTRRTGCASSRCWACRSSPRILALRPMRTACAISQSSKRR